MLCVIYHSFEKASHDSFLLSASYVPDTVLDLHSVSHLIFTTVLWGKNCYSYFTGKEIDY